MDVHWLKSFVSSSFLTEIFLQVLFLCKTKFLKMLKEYCDTISTVLVILAVIIFIVIAAIFLTMQVNLFQASSGMSQFVHDWQKFSIRLLGWASWWTYSCLMVEIRWRVINLSSFLVTFDAFRECFICLHEIILTYPKNCLPFSIGMKKSLHWKLVTWLISSHLLYVF